MKCSRCGAENAAYMEACGNCGLPFSSSGYGPQAHDEVSRSADHVTFDDEPVEHLPSQARPMRHHMMAPSIGGLVLAVILLVLTVVQLLTSRSGDDDFPMEAVFAGLSAMFLISSFLLSRKQGSRTSQYLWLSGDSLSPMAKSRGASILGFLAIPFVMFIPIIVGVFLFSDWPILFGVALGLLLSIALANGFIRSRVMVQGDGVIVGIPSGPMMLRLPFDKMDSVRLRGRVLKITLTARINPLSFKTFRYLILGDPVPVATAIQAVGVVHGLDIIVENVEISPRLLKSCMDAVQHKDGGASRASDDLSVIDARLYAATRSPYPDVISSLLVFAGISTIVTGVVLTYLDRLVAEDIGRHLAYIECCAMLEFLFGILIIAGAVMARRRRRYGLVRVSAILAIISFGGFISTILGVISLVLLMRSADEFEG